MRNVRCEERFFQDGRIKILVNPVFKGLDLIGCEMAVSITKNLVNIFMIIGHWSSYFENKSAFVDHNRACPGGGGGGVPIE